jgi:hypothetical protein
MAERRGAANKSTCLLILYYLAFSIGLLAESQLRPKYNPDMVASVACAWSYEIKDEGKLYSAVFSEIQETVDPVTFRKLTRDTRNRSLREITLDWVWLR